jgi:hypothetical protein
MPTLPRAVGRVRARRVLFVGDCGIKDEMKLGTVHVGLAGHDGAVIHGSDEISAYKHDQWCTLLGGLAMANFVMSIPEVASSPEAIEAWRDPVRTIEPVLAAPTNSAGAPPGRPR